MFIKSLKHAIEGIRYGFISERNMKIHGVIFLLVIACGIFFHIRLLEWMLILIVSSGVIASELINTAIEILMDWIHPDKDEHVRKIKDLCAGAVLVHAIIAAIVGLIIFVPYGLALLTNLFF